MFEYVCLKMKSFAVEAWRNSRYNCFSFLNLGSSKYRFKTMKLKMQFDVSSGR